MGKRWSVLRSSEELAPVADDGGPLKLRAVSIVDLFMVAAGVVLNIAAYQSVEPVFAFAIVYCIAVWILVITGSDGYFERKILNATFAIYWAIGGLAAVYAAYFNDQSQLYGDAAYFYAFASGPELLPSLAELKELSEGGLALKIWDAMYRIAYLLGMPGSRSVGISANAITVSLAAVVSVRTAKRLFGNDHYRLTRLVRLYSWCGLLWVLACLHLRDAYALLLVNLLVFYWILYGERPASMPRLLLLVVASVLGGYLSYYLRSEFVYVPVVMTGAGVSAFLLSARSKWLRRTSLVTLLVVGVSTLLLISTIENVLFDLVMQGQAVYGGKVGAEASADSLGLRLIVDQDPLTRIVLGSVYLFIFPIPLWSGVSAGTAYMLFKSAGAPFFYFVLPLIAYGVAQYVKRTELRVVGFTFILILSVGLTLSVVLSSLESRHMAAFLGMLYMLALIPDLRVSQSRRTYRLLAGVMVCGILAIHVLWFLIKFY